MHFDLYHSDGREEALNCVYPHKVTVYGREDLKRAVRNDYVCAEYEDNRRGNGAFIGSDCLAFDCDNDHSDEPREWIFPSDIARAFPDVGFAVHYSRSNMMPKGNKSPRPRFHVFFPTERITDAEEYAGLKRRVYEYFPYFDRNALDAARFFFGTDIVKVDLIDGDRPVTDVLGPADAEPAEAPAVVPRKSETKAPVAAAPGPAIPEGNRNVTLSRYAARTLKRLGNCGEAKESFLRRAADCVPPLGGDELEAIWNSALRFYNRVSASADYVPPEQFASRSAARGPREDEAGGDTGSPDPEGPALMPTDMSDVGQAQLLAAEYGTVLRYSGSTGFLVYNGKVWEESDSKARMMAQSLTDRQLAEAKSMLESAREEARRSGADRIVGALGTKKAAGSLDPAQRDAMRRLKEAEKYLEFAGDRRDSTAISATLREVIPLVEVDPEELDAEPFLLNTPGAVWDLSLGMEGGRERSCADLMTKMTAVDPSDEGGELWQKALDTFFGDDGDMQRYVKQLVGLCAVGKVCAEGMIIAFGEGRNGKSTFWNTLGASVVNSGKITLSVAAAETPLLNDLGKTTGDGSVLLNLSADALTVGCRRNVKPELAEVKGKRLVIAAELEEGVRLNTSIVKQLCSTDAIYAEKKYRDPFSFTPSHTVVLYTNHLPKVGALDEGTWRRLNVVPFNAKIEGDGDVKNYAEYLFDNAGGAVLKWIIEGAKEVVDVDFRIEPAFSAALATETYRENNDWLRQFLDERCDLGPNYTAKSGEVFKAYREYCAETGEYARSTTDFYAALENAGYERRRTASARVIAGLRLRPLYSGSL